MPIIVEAVPIEDELHEQLAAAGEVRVVDGRDRAAVLAAVQGGGRDSAQPRHPRR